MSGHSTEGGNSKLLHGTCTLTLKEIVPEEREGGREGGKEGGREGGNEGGIYIYIYIYRREENE